jgi:hypothetical protein
MKPNKITDDEVKNKSRIEFGQPELLLIANGKQFTVKAKVHRFLTDNPKWPVIF